MSNNNTMDDWEKLGQSLLEGKAIGEITLKGKTYKFNYTYEEFCEKAMSNGWPKSFIDEKVWPRYKAFQSEFISNFQDKRCLNTGGFGSGKSLALYMKLVLTCRCFPNNRVLLGRKTISDIERASLPDLFEIMPSSWYDYRVKDGTINFKNGSQIILFGLDSMQSGGAADIKKAEQKLKSLNLGAYFIDQLEEVEESVIKVLDSRLRRTNVPFRQGNATTNPANFWAYDYYIANPRPGYKTYQSSMIFNPNLPWDYIEDQLSRDEDYVKRFVYGEWTTDLLLHGAVFDKQEINYLESMKKEPIEIDNACEIYEPPKGGVEYRMGVDPSTGAVDPSSISVVSSEGRKVARFSGQMGVNELADKVRFLYYKYNKPLIIPEVNCVAGGGLIREISDLNVYKRKDVEVKYAKESEKLGFRSSQSSKSHLISHFKRLLHQNVPKIYDKETISQMRVYEWSNEIKQQGAGAARGFHDDDIMSTMLAFWDFYPDKVVEKQIAKSRPKGKRVFQYS